MIIDKNWHILLIHTKSYTKHERKRKITKQDKLIDQLDIISFQSRHDTASTNYSMGTCNLIG